jgi:hypothetical protein
MVLFIVTAMRTAHLILPACSALLEIQMSRSPPNFLSHILKCLVSHCEPGCRNVLHVYKSCHTRLNRTFTSVAFSFVRAMSSPLLPRVTLGSSVSLCPFLHGTFFPSSFPLSPPQNMGIMLPAHG